MVKTESRRYIIMINLYCNENDCEIKYITYNSNVEGGFKYKIGIK